MRPSRNQSRTFASVLSSLLGWTSFAAACLALSPIPTQAEEEKEQALFQFGAIADCQYHDSDSRLRRYNQSPEKLHACIADFNKQELSHIVHLGDFIDRDWESFDVVLPIAAQAKAPFYHALGNHDFSVADEYKFQVPAKLGLQERYYDFAVQDWRFLILDTNDLSLRAYPEGSPEYEHSLKIYNELGGDFPSYNGGIGKKQLEWIEAKLQAAQSSGESVILLSHHPVYPSLTHSIWNAKQVMDVLEQYSCVAAYMNGHLHTGGYGFKNGIHYLTLKGMVDTEETAYAVISVYPERIEVKGVGRQDDYFLGLQKR